VAYTTGNFPFSVAAADFNGDGVLDLAVSNNHDTTVSILLGKGDGTFQPKVDFPATNLSFGGPTAIATGDFNGDGIVDLAVANGGANQVSILLGNGDGTFQSPLEFTSNPSLGVAVGDFNGDGRLDVAVTNDSVGGRTLSVLLQTPPPAPATNLTAAVGGGPPPAAQSVTLVWTASASSNVVGYNVYRGTSAGGPFTNIASVGPASIGYVDTTVVSGTTYYYVVTTVGLGNAQSVNSNEAVAVVP
jgi:hypothetical protein